MDEQHKQLDMCVEDEGAKQSSETEIACGNQEVPEDLQDKNEKHEELRKVGGTPSSMGLPKINLADFDKWASVATQSKSLQNDCRPEPEVTSTEEPPECSEAPEAWQPVSTESDAQGRVVRERFASGPDVVVAYDENGNAHRFNNEPITQMPPDFEQVPEFRQKQLDGQAKELLDKYSEPQYDGEDRSMDFQRVADMQKEIAQRQDLTETEKCLLYSKIQVSMREGGMKVENWNEKLEMIDSWTGQSDPWHAIAPIDDKYHNRLANMSKEDASKAIYEQEDHTEGDMHDSWIKRQMWKGARWGMGINQGDINASEAQVECMRQLKDKGTFAAYADEWEKQYVDKGGVNPRHVDPTGGAQGAGPEGGSSSGQGGANGH